MSRRKHRRRKHHSPFIKKLNYESLGERLRRMANNMTKIDEAIAIIEDAKRRNPNNLPF